MNSKLHHDIKQENELQNLSKYFAFGERKFRFFLSIVNTIDTISFRIFHITLYFNQAIFVYWIN